MSHTVAVIDYGSGNLRSAAKALKRCADSLHLKTEVRVTAEPDAVAGADAIVLPGVGAFADCRRGLAALDGMEQALSEAVEQRGRPFLGICVGMQLMASRGHEHGLHEGLAWLDGDVVALEPSDPALKVPHMGWNDLVVTDSSHPLLEGIATGDHAYFVHSYRFAPEAADKVLAEVDYGGLIVAAVGRDNLAGTQFHPEKSQATGLRLLGNFLRWRP